MNKFNLINTTLTFQAIRSKLTGNIIWSTIVNTFNQNIMLDSKDFKEDVFKEFERLFVTFYNSDYIVPLNEILYEDKYKDLIEVISGEINLTSPLSIEQQIERIILIHDDKYTNSLNIRIGDILNHYDDGKIRNSRKYKVLITDIVKYDENREEMLREIYERMLCSEYEYLDRTFTTPYFIKGLLYVSDTHIEPIVYVLEEEYDEINEQTYYKWCNLDTGNNWFTNGRLDIDGKLTESIQ